jgi:GT2 family glycosyltransferase
MSGHRTTRVLCSVCIANYNGESLLDDCLRSVLEQDVEGEVEILVHDDASSDRSLDVLTTYPDVTVLTSDVNVGFCEANNRMVAARRGEFILLLNNDAALWPGALSALLAEARSMKRPSILTLPQYDWMSGDIVDRGCLLDPFCNPVPNLDIERHDVAMVIGACMWMPRHLWDVVGGFPTWIGSIAEDMYMCCAVRQQGYDVRCVTTSGYRHRQGASFGGNKASGDRLSSTYRRRALSERNKTFMLILFTPRPWLLLVLILHILTLVAEGSLLALLRKDIRLWREVYSAAVGAAWRHRRMLARLRATLLEAAIVGPSHYYSTFTWVPRKLSMLKRYGLPDLR